MAKLLVIELDSEEEEFLGFNVECKLQRGELAESESDITVLTVNMEDLSDFNVTSSESNKEVDVELDSFPNSVVVNPFVANTAPVRDVSGFSDYIFFI